MLGTPCPNKSILFDLDPRYERYGTGTFPFDGMCTGTGILLPVPSSPGRVWARDSLRWGRDNSMSTSSFAGGICV
jgi:hypothetical protein